MGVMRREPRETGGGDGVGSPPLVVRSLFSFGVSVILKSDSDMTKEEAKERFGDNIINKLLSLGAEPTNVCRNDDIVEWCSDGCIKVGDIEVKDKTLRYSVYRDGCFYPYYGKLEVAE